jgi:hypothetical protein
LEPVLPVTHQMLQQRQSHPLRGHPDRRVRLRQAAALRLRFDRAALLAASLTGGLTFDCAMADVPAVATAEALQVEALESALTGTSCASIVTLSLCRHSGMPVQSDRMCYCEVACCQSWLPYARGVWRLVNQLQPCALRGYASASCMNPAWVGLPAGCWLLQGHTLLVGYGMCNAHAGSWWVAVARTRTCPSAGYWVQPQQEAYTLPSKLSLSPSSACV